MDCSTILNLSWASHFPKGYEPETQRIFRKVLKERDQCIIAGAHQGFFTVLAASLVGPSGKVFAFEPEMDNFMMLMTNTENFDNIWCFNYALGDKNRKAPFYVNADNDGGHALWDVRKFASNVKTIANPESYQIEVKRLDDVMEDKNLERLKLCLFDVEGAEHSLLKGAINTIVDNTVPYIVCEINNPALEICGTSQKELRSYMEMYGYKMYLLEQGGTIEVSNIKDLSLKHEEQEVVFNVLFSRMEPG
jgi:FkbM family methyltransferase